MRPMKNSNAVVNEQLGSPVPTCSCYLLVRARGKMICGVSEIASEPRTHTTTLDLKLAHFKLMWNLMTHLS